MPLTAMFVPKLVSIIAAATSFTASCHAFVAPGPARAKNNDVRLGVKLEGRDIEGALKPTNNFILVKVADIEDETEGGILLTGSVSYVAMTSNSSLVRSSNILTQIMRPMFQHCAG